MNPKIGISEGKMPNYNPINRNQFCLTSFPKHVGNESLRKSDIQFLLTFIRTKVMLDEKPKFSREELTPEIVRRLYWKVRSSRGYIETRLEIESQDHEILTQLYTILVKLDFTPKLYLTKKSGTKIGPFILKKDMYRLSLIKRKETIRLAKLLLSFVRHPERKQRIELLIKAAEHKRYDEIKDMVIDFRSKVKDDVIKFRKLTQENYEESLRRTL